MLAVLLGWNAWLTYRLVDLSSETSSSSSASETTIISTHTVNGYTTDVTEAAALVQPSIVEITARNEDMERISSGFVYETSETDCFIVTSYNALISTTDLTVCFDNGIEVEAALLGYDELTDVALLLTRPGFTTTPIELGDSDLVSQGEYVISMGCRESDTQRSLISFGVVSKTSMMLTTNEEDAWIVDTLVTDTELTRVSYGGPLVNISGQLIGMMSYALSVNNGASGMNSALTSNELALVVSELRSSEGMTRTYLGVIGRNVEELEVYEKSAMNMTLDTSTGVVVTYVEEGSPAQISGIEKNDVITGINDTTVETVSDLKRLLYDLSEEEDVSIRLIREGESLTLPLRAS